MNRAITLQELTFNLLLVWTNEQLTSSQTFLSLAKMITTARDCVYVLVCLFVCKTDVSAVADSLGGHCKDEGGQGVQVPK